MPEVSRRRALWIEVITLSVWLIVPGIVSGLLYGRQASGDRYSASALVERIVWGFGNLAILSFIVWNSGDALSQFGVRRFRAIRDLPLGLLIAILLYGSFILPIRIHRGFDVAQTAHRLFSPDGLPLLSLSLTSILVFVCVEELLFRGILIPRLEELSGNVWIGISVSAILFAVGHVYQGWFGVARAFALGIMNGVAFHRTRSLWPGLVGHLAFNLAVVWVI